MIELARIVRFAVNAGGESAPMDPHTDNGYAGRPSMRGLGRYYELEVRCRGDVDPVTGYFMPIADVDRAVRQVAVPAIARACAESPESDPALLMAGLVGAVNEAVDGRLRSLRWRLTPYYCVEMNVDRTDTVILRQRFDFAAAHRLHAAEMSDAQNRALFGKCNNPNYHGHNYQLEPAVAVELDGHDLEFSIQQLERLVQEHVLDSLDHRNLNLDIEAFDGQGGVNPSVENIARFCFEVLSPQVARVSGGKATLRQVTVWETDRTCCTYPA